MLDGDDAACDGVQLTDQPVVTVTPTPDTTFTTSDHIICEGTAATIALSDTETSINYRLKTGGASGTTVETVAGTGSNISFSQSPTANTFYTITAQSSLNAGSCVELAVNSSSVTVIATPITSTTLVVADFEYCNEVNPGTLTLTVTNTQTGYDYQLRDPSDNPLDTVAGSGSSFRVTLKHQPEEAKTTTSDSSVGGTDVDVSFSLSIQTKKQNGHLNWQSTRISRMCVLFVLCHL